MATHISHLLLLTMYCVLLNGSKRVTKMIYIPYGPKMCRRLSEDVNRSYVFIKEDLSCVLGNGSWAAQNHSLTSINKETLMTSSKSLEASNLHESCEEYSKDESPFDVLQEPTGNASAGNLEAHHNALLHQACEEGLLCKVKYIIWHRLADINCRGKYGRTPIMVAAKYGLVAIFNFLVSKDCDLETRDVYNDTILHLASVGGDINIIRRLFQIRKFDIDVKGKKQRTPVMAAAYCGHGEAFNFLVNKNCNLTLHDHFSDNILHMACRGGNIDIVRYILSQNITNINTRGYMDMTPLMMAAEKGHDHIYFILQNAGCDVETVDLREQNTLHVACSGGHLSMVKYLISLQIYDIESREYRGRTPLMVAAEEGHVGVFEFLVWKGCDLRAVDRYRDNILHIACQGGHVDIVKHVISRGLFSINCTGYKRQTPVMMAAGKGHKDVVKLLVGIGCNMRMVDDEKNNLLHVACISGHLDVVKYILSKHTVDIDGRAASRRTAVMIAVIKGHREVVELLVSNACNVKLTDKFSYNILHLACINGDVEIVRYILAQEIADLDIPGYGGMTPLSLARENGHMEVVKLLQSLF